MFHCILFLAGGFNPSEKYDFVSWDDDIPNCFWKVIKSTVPNHQPAILYTLGIYMGFDEVTIICALWLGYNAANAAVGDMGLPFGVIKGTVENPQKDVIMGKLSIWYGNSRILKWRYCTIYIYKAIFCGDMVGISILYRILKFGLNNMGDFHCYVWLRTYSVGSARSQIDSCGHTLTASKAPLPKVLQGPHRWPCFVLWSIAWDQLQVPDCRHDFQLHKLWLRPKQLENVLPPCVHILLNIKALSKSKPFRHVTLLGQLEIDVLAMCLPTLPFSSGCIRPWTAAMASLPSNWAALALPPSLPRASDSTHRHTNTQRWRAIHGG